VEHAIALLGGVEQGDRDELGALIAQIFQRRRLSTATWPGMPSHSNVCTTRFGATTSARRSVES
jgi:hypothetical protein